MRSRKTRILWQLSVLTYILQLAFLSDSLSFPIEDELGSQSHESSLIHQHEVAHGYKDNEGKVIHLDENSHADVNHGGEFDEMNESFTVGSDSEREGNQRNNAKSRQDDGGKQTQNSNFQESTTLQSKQAIIVCGVDGTVYTLDAWSGQLRGMFSSGDPLITGKKKVDDSQETDISDQIIPGLNGNLYVLTSDNSEEAINSLASSSLKYKMDILPIKVQDIVQNPYRTCSKRSKENSFENWASETFWEHNNRYQSFQNEDIDDYEEECGMVMGESSVKVYAIDPKSGTVQWMQNPKGKEKGFTSKQAYRHHTSPNEVKTVLLKREDYSVRHVNLDSGNEFWQVNVAVMSDLIFYNNYEETYSDPKNRAKWGFARECSLTENIDTGIPQLTSRIGPSQRSYPQQQSTVTRNQLSELSDSNFVTFPSIVKGSDGRSFIAIDDRTGAKLWEKKIESTIAFIQGVGKDWVALNVMRESEYTFAFSSSDNTGTTEDDGFALNVKVNLGDSREPFGILPPSASFLSTLPLAKLPRRLQSPMHPHSSIDPASELTYSHGSDSQLVTYNHPSMIFGDVSKIGTESSPVAKVGKYSSSLFVESILDFSERREEQVNLKADHLKRINGMPNRLTLPGGKATQPLLSSIDVGNKSPPEEMLNIWENADSKMNHDHLDLARTFLEMQQKSPWKLEPQSHHTKNGLFLTWEMITVLGLSLVIGVLGGRFLYLKKKKKWIMVSPAMNSEKSNTSRKDLRATPTEFSLGENYEDLHVPSSFTLERGPHSVSMHHEGMSQTILSSPSPVLRSASLPHLNLYSNGHTSVGPESDLNRMLDLPELSLGRGSLPMPKAIPTANSASTRNPTPSIPVDQSKSTEKHGKPQRSTSVDEVNGIPLVRYSRYASEFTELSPLGKGGFGTVFKCKNSFDGRDYAVKKVIIKSAIDSDGQLPKQFTQTLQRVLREVKILAYLDHPNIVRYYTAWLEVDTVEKFLEGQKNSRQENTPRGSTCGFSSNLLAGPLSTTPDNPSPVNCVRNNKKRGRPTEKVLPCKSLTSTNPLGWNNFSLSGSASFDDEPSSQLKEVSGKCGGGQRQSTSSICSEEDLGFNWERSDSGLNQSIHRAHLSRKCLTPIEDSSESDSYSSSGHSASSESEGSWSMTSDDSHSNDRDETKYTHSTVPNAHELGFKTKTITEDSTYDQRPLLRQRHILYIQMQLSKRTILDFFHDREKRDKDDIDIPFALKIFGNIAKGLKHVHEQGLIHRDLKPSNCFMDDSEVVKIGDFGLSRESGSNHDILEEQDLQTMNDGSSSQPDITAGVGTTNYASPEQISGSDYNASTDIYSLGIMLFELCYPMYTVSQIFWHFSFLTDHHS